jgi:hypothetical protein
MVMACLSQHISDVGLTLALQLVCQHREVRGNDVFYLPSTRKSLPVDRDRLLGFSRVSHLSGLGKLGSGDWRGPHGAQKRLGDYSTNQREGCHNKADTAAQAETLLVGHRPPSQASLMAGNAQTRSQLPQKLPAPWDGSWSLGIL